MAENKTPSEDPILNIHVLMDYCGFAMNIGWDKTDAKEMYAFLKKLERQVISLQKRLESV